VSFVFDEAALTAACRAGFGSEPPNSGTGASGVGSLLAWLLERVARRRFKTEDLLAGYCARSPREVVAQACVPFTAPCADLSGVAALLLARCKIPTTLVLAGIARPFRPVKFQCGLELDLDGGTWVAGFGIARAVLYRGHFRPTPRRPWVFRRRPPALDLDRPFLAYFHDDARDGLSSLVPGYDLARDLRDHVRRSSAISFHMARLQARSKTRAPAISARPRWEAA
jgi:hypothetical protein